MSPELKSSVMKGVIALVIVGSAAADRHVRRLTGEPAMFAISLNPIDWVTDAAGAVLGGAAEFGARRDRVVARGRRPLRRHGDRRRS